MARPPKKGIDYFPMDVTDTINVRLLLADTGMTGFAILIKLWQKIYGENGYYCRFDEDVLMLFANEYHLTPTQVKKTLDAALKRGLFDKTLYQKEQILTSADIQERFLEATKRRLAPELRSDYCLLSVDNNPQSKEKKKEKEKEKKVYLSAGAQQKKAEPPIRRSTFNNYNDPNAEAAIAQMNAYLQAQGMQI